MWDRAAACNGTAAEWWFPSGKPTELELARCQAICRTCPVQSECLEEGMRPENIGFGIWAGTTPAERLQMREPRPPLHRLFRFSEIANRLGMSREHVYMVYHRRRFPAWKIDNAMHARPEDVWNAAKLGEKRKASA